MALGFFADPNPDFKNPDPEWDLNDVLCFFVFFVFFMDPDPDPDFWPILIRTQEKSPIRIRTKGTGS